MTGLLTSVRIGLEIGLFCWLLHIAFYAAGPSWFPELAAQVGRSAKSRGLLTFALMFISLFISSWLENAVNGMRFGVQSLTSSALLSGLFLILFSLYSAYQDVARHNLALRAESAESSLQTLKDQLQPHFLFNSLNSLAELIEVNPARAAEMAQKLSDLYRLILESSHHPLCELAHELEIVERYLELEKIRHGKRLIYSIVGPSESGTCLVPSLILQTLVENALKHGISHAIEGGYVEVRIEHHGNDGFLASVTNSLAPGSNELSQRMGELQQGTGETTRGTGTGLTNARARLALLYGPRGSLSISEATDSFAVSFWFSGEKSDSLRSGT